MSDPERSQPAKLDTDDLELLIAAIERLSTKVDGIKGNAPTFSPDQAVRLSKTFAEKAEHNTIQNLSPVLNQIQIATDKLEKETNRAASRERAGHLSDTERVIRDNRWWRIGAVGAVILILAGAWLGHGFIVRTVSGCFILGGEFINTAPNSGTPAFCAFDKRSLR